MVDDSRMSSYGHRVCQMLDESSLPVKSLELVVDEVVMINSDAPLYPLESRRAGPPWPFFFFWIGDAVAIVMQFDVFIARGTNLERNPREGKFTGF